MGLGPGLTEARTTSRRVPAGLAGTAGPWATPPASASKNALPGLITVTQAGDSTCPGRGRDCRQRERSWGAALRQGFRLLAATSDLGAVSDQESRIALPLGTGITLTPPDRDPYTSLPCQTRRARPSLLPQTPGSSLASPLDWGSVPQSQSSDPNPVFPEDRRVQADSTDLTQTRDT